MLITNKADTGHRKRFVDTSQTPTVDPTPNQFNPSNLARHLFNGKWSPCALLSTTPWKHTRGKWGQSL